MKKYVFVIFAFALLAAVMSAAADSVWMPMDDYFMDTWKPESDNTCKSQERVLYLAAGEKGFVTAVKTPLDQTPVKTYPNGTEFKIAFICGKGDNLWGAVEAIRLSTETTFTEDWQGESGYIALGDLVRSYDSEAFKEDHIKELASVGEDDFNFCGGEEFVLWSAPNSGVQLEYVYSGYIDYLCYGYDGGKSPVKYDAFYRDPEGRAWVEITLRRPTEHGWYCIDAPTEGGIKPEY